LTFGVAVIAFMVLLGTGVAAAHRAHTIHPGESLWSIAAANGLSVEAIATANGLPPDAHLIAGTVVQIPDDHGHLDGAAIGGTGACVADCASTVHPHLTDEVVSPGVVGEIAAQYGMSPGLVQAIASVESGFDNSALSTADARGVMQIIPDTWELIDQTLAPQPLDPVSARRNVEAGVLYLRHLYRLKGGDRNLTIGSYFQGPHRAELLPETHEYIDLVNRRQAELGGG
jgi:N-acetylmuramoyl-L-alanine amidase